MLKLIAVAVTAAFAPRFMAEATPASSTTEKGKRFASKDYDLDTGEFEIEWKDGTSTKFNVDELPDEMKRKLMFHGFSQKVGDSYASAKGDIAKARTSAEETIAQLQKGEWTGERDSESRPRLGELAAAISSIKGIPLEDATAAVTAAAESGDEGAAKLKTWRAHPKIKAAILKARAEKAQAEVDAQTEVADIEV